VAKLARNQVTKTLLWQAAHILPMNLSNSQSSAAPIL